MNKFLVGWAEESLVPDKPVRLAGQFFERISTHVETPISATAMAIEQGDEQMILVSVDIVGLPKTTIDAAREKMSKLVDDFDTTKLIALATHSHTSILHGNGVSTLSQAQVILNRYLPEDNQYTPLVEADDSVLTPQEGFELITDKIALAAANAWKNRKPAMYANEFGRAAVGMCRRVSYDDGTSQMWGEVTTPNFVALEGGNDNGVELLYMFDENKNLTGIVANIACPSQVVEHRSFISADYWGEAKRYLREKFGEDIFLLGMGGAGGDQCPRDLIRWVQPESPIDDPNINREHYFERKADPSMFDIKGCRLVGKRVANEIISVFEEIEEIKDDALLMHETMMLDLPLRRVTMTDYKNAVESIQKYVEQNKDKEVFNFADNAKMHVHAGTIARFEKQQDTDFVPTEVHIVRFGDIAIATNPFELFLDFGNQMKARCRTKQLFVAQLCADSLGYLPTEKAEDAGHYSAYVSSGTVGHVGGEILVRKTIETVNKMFN